ncbi:MAG: alpha/beta fold hydrolase [Solidesulfovibrio sp. DCME]|uniref:alpha/beta fold hydrolase n=1 Tax=Solidesulfovibrio sp. DCME TaxID=3447380 RepID=UPI003D0E4508
MATFVCVHGAFQGGWVFRNTAAALFSLGHAAHAPTFSGCGHHRGAKAKDMGLADYVRELTAYLELFDLGQVILVAHSYSGIVCAAAMPGLLPRLAAFVSLEGIIPKPGASFADLGGEPFRAMLEARRLDGGLVSPWPAAMFGVAGAPDEDWFMSRLAPFPMAAFTDAVPDGELVLPAKRHYVRCLDNPNPMLAAMAERARGLGFAMHELRTGHCPQITVPVDVARLLAAIAENGAS